MVAGATAMGTCMCGCVVCHIFIFTYIYERLFVFFPLFGCACAHHCSNKPRPSERYGGGGGGDRYGYGYGFLPLFSIDYRRRLFIYI